MLNKLLTEQDVKQVHLHLLESWLREAEDELRDAMDIAARRSGTRGKAARLEVIKKENNVSHFKDRCVEPRYVNIPGCVTVDGRCHLRLEGVRTGAPVGNELNEVQVMDQALALLTTLNLQLDTVSPLSLADLTVCSSRG